MQFPLPVYHYIVIFTFWRDMTCDHLGSIRPPLFTRKWKTHTIPFFHLSWLHSLIGSCWKVNGRLYGFVNHFWCCRHPCRVQCYQIWQCRYSTLYAVPTAFATIAMFGYRSRTLTQISTSYSDVYFYGNLKKSWTCSLHHELLGLSGCNTSFYYAFQRSCLCFSRILASGMLNLFLHKVQWDSTWLVDAVLYLSHAHYRVADYITFWKNCIKCMG